MTTTTLSVNPSNIGTNGKTSPGVNIPANTYSIWARLVAPNWFTTTGTVTYRVDVLINGSWLQAMATETPLVMGSTAKDGGLPLITCDSPVLAQATQVRVYVQCSKTLSIGADVTIYSDFVPS